MTHQLPESRLPRVARAHELGARSVGGRAPGARDLAGLQRSAGNRAVTAALRRARAARVQRAANDELPADLDPGFNPHDIAHRLVEAIDQSDIKSVSPPIQRHVDLAAVVAALNGRTVEQIREIDVAYQSFEHRSLRTDLLGYGESGFPADLTLDGITRVRVLLDATAASPDEGELAAGLAELNRLDADAAELHSLLMGDLEAAAIERVMALLRRDAAANQELAKHYSVLAGRQPTGREHVPPTLIGDLGQLRTRYLTRAMYLYFGQTLSADQLQIADLRGRIEAVDESIAELRAEAKHGMAFVFEAKIGELQKKRRGLVAEMEAFVAQTGAEARKESLDQADASDPEEAMAAADKSAKERMRAVLGSDAELTGAGIVGADAAALRSLVTDDSVGSASAHLLQLREAGDLKTEAITEALRGLRDQAEVQARRALPMESPDVVEKAAEDLAADYTRRLPDLYDAARPAGTPTFRVLAATGSDIEVGYNTALLVRGGRLDPVQELRFALAGDRHDLETVKRVLRDKSAAEILEIKRQFPELEFELFGQAPTTAGEDNDVKTAVAAMISAGGKASGADRLILEDYLQRPTAQGGPAEEGRYLRDRAEREYQYAIDNRGFTGWWRDHWGNEARALMDESITNIRRLYQQFVTSGSTDTALLQEMRLWRSTIRGDRAGYEKANAELRATFEAVAAFALQVALTALLTPAAAALLRVAEGAEAAVMAARAVKIVRGVLVNTVSTVGANAAVHDNYGAAALEHDLLGGLGSLVGAGTVGKLSGVLGKPFVTSLVGREAISAAQTVAGIEATALLEGRSLTADLTVRNFLIMHGQGKVMHAVGEAVSPEERAGAGADRGGASESGATGSGAQPAGLAPEALEPEASGTTTSMALPEPAPAPAAPSGRGPLQMSGAELTEFAAEVLRRPVNAMEGKAFFYDDVASYEAEFTRRFPGRRPPAGGYFDPNVGDLHVSPRGNLLTVLHEAIHKVAGETSPLAKQLLGQYLNEGITEEITRSRLGARAGKHAYDRNVAVVEVLQDRLGVSVVENAILHGDYRSFREAVRARLGGSEAETLEFMRLLQSVGPTSHDSAALQTALDMLDGRAEPRAVRPPAEPTSEPGGTAPEASPVATGPARVSEVYDRTAKRLRAIDEAMSRRPELRNQFQGEVRALHVEFARLRAIFKDLSPDTPTRSGGLDALRAVENMQTIDRLAAETLDRIGTAGASGKEAPFDNAAFAEQVRTLPVEKRVVLVERTAARIAGEQGWEYDNRVSSMNNRSVYRDGKGNYWSVDTQHGTFEHCNSLGKHQGEYNYVWKQLEEADKKGQHDIKV